ncbi:MAG TPA: lantibiotic dehydratase [Myxococcales bacterium LLY-WYZ-16_1]|nr:lantibiotic dehydratase [Myxococcales bacterium LLY-WYZ-16_1]
MQPSLRSVALAEGWSVFDQVELRGAGFSISLVDSFRSPELLYAFEQWRAALDAWQTRREATISALKRHRFEAPTWKEVRKLIRRLSKDQPVQGAPEGFEAAFAALEAARWARERARADYERMVEAARLHSGRAARAAVADPRFRAAMLWQNPRILERLRLAQWDPGDSSQKNRRDEELVARYAQRYGAKNDTIGFFGPTAWARLDPDSPTLVDARPAPGPVGNRRVFLEHWAAEAVLARLDEWEPARAHACPRRRPALSVQSGEVRLDGKAKVLPREVVEVLSACDGRTPVHVLRSRWAATGRDLDRWEALLLELEDAGWVELRHRLPAYCLDPRAELSDRLDALPVPDGLRASWQELEAALARLEPVAEQPEALAEALKQVERAFEAASHTSAHRSAGQLYAGRTVVFEDCIRAGRWILGRPMLDLVVPPLLAVLQSARWWVDRLTETVLRRAEAQVGTASEVPLSSFLRAFLPWLEEAPFLSTLQEDLRNRWRPILEDPAALATAETLRARVHKAFPHGGRGWPGCRFHSPDILLARGPGRPDRAVLGELHLATHTQLPVTALALHPDPDGLLRWCRDALGGPICVPVPRRRDVHRALPWPPHPSAVLLETSLDTAAGTRAARAVGELSVRATSGGLRVVGPDLDLPLLALLDGHLSDRLASTFRVTGGGRHEPRITVDGLVIGREGWAFDAAELVFARGADRNERLRGTLAWRAQHGLPERFFVKASSEAKPFLCDLANPLSVENLCRVVRECSAIRCTELLPDFDDCWLEDGSGGRSTSEFRFVFVDERVRVPLHPEEQS